MALAVTITKVARIGAEFRIGFKLAASGSYPAGGDTVNFATATQDPSFVGTVPDVVALGAPLSFNVWSQGGNLLVQYVPVIGTLQTNCKLKMATTWGTEATAGTYASISSSIAADTLVGEASFVAL